MPQARAGRKTARGIVIKDGKVLLLERWRTDKTGAKLHYFSIPGGGIEQGEIPEATVVREVFEEACVLVRPIRKVADQFFEDGGSTVYLLCAYLSGEPGLNADAPESQTKDNRSKPRWLAKNEVLNIEFNVRYKPMQSLVLKALDGKIPEKPIIIK